VYSYGVIKEPQVEHEENENREYGHGRHDMQKEKGASQEAPGCYHAGLWGARRRHGGESKCPSKKEE
jgi:hypothetical protein